MKLTNEQYEQLLKPLNASRVAQRNQAGISLSYLEAWDVKAHLIRIFGFAGWSADVLSADLAFEEKDEKGRWNVGYRVVMRLRIHGNDDFLGDASYTEAAVGSSTQPQRGEAHDMAIKTAESDALKRAAINLGTQFGLSLYDNGNRNDVVKKTLVPPLGHAAIDEPAPNGDIAEAIKQFTPPKPDVRSEVLLTWAAEAEVSESREELKEIWDGAVEQNVLDAPIRHAGAGTTIRQVIVDRLAVLGEQH